MHKILQKNKYPKTESITLSEIRGHQLFIEFEFTVDQIVDMCYDDKLLDELYQQQTYHKGLSALTSPLEVGKFRFENMSKK
jgi:hypothetical protein